MRERNFFFVQGPYERKFPVWTLAEVSLMGLQTDRPSIESALIANVSSVYAALAALDDFFLFVIDKSAPSPSSVCLSVFLSVFLSVCVSTRRGRYADKDSSRVRVGRIAKEEEQERGLTEELSARLPEGEGTSQATHRKKEKKRRRNFHALDRKEEEEKAVEEEKDYHGNS